MLSGVFYHKLFGPVYFQWCGVWLVFNILSFIRIPVVNAKCVDSDQVLQSVVSTLFANYPSEVSRLTCVI